MKSNEYYKEENIIFFLLCLCGLFICVLFALDFIENSKRIENPSMELIEKVEKKYLNGKLVDDFKIDDSIFNDSIFNGSTPEEKENCDTYWKNSQNIKFSKREVYFNDEVIIKIKDLPDDDKKLFENLYEREHKRCLLDKQKRKINRELNLVK